MRILTICVMLLAASCRDQAPPAPSAEQSEQLNETEDMLNSLATNEEGPETNAPGPSNSH